MTINKKDEIVFENLFILINKYRNLIIVLPLIFPIAVVFFMLVFIHPNFKAEATIKIGLMNNIVIEDKEDVKSEILSEPFLIEVNKRLPDNFSKDKNVYDSKLILKKILLKSDKNKNLIYVSTLADTPANSVSLLTAIVEVLQMNHKKLLDQFKNVTQNELNLTNEQINKMKSELTKVKDKDFSLTDGKINAEVFILFEHLQNLQHLFDRAFTLQAKLYNLSTYNTDLESSIKVSNKPEDRNLLLIALSSYLLGIFLVFLLISIKQSKEE